MICDWDDLREDSDLSLLYALKEINEDFCCTLFAIPAECSREFLLDLPPWLEVAMHGWRHGDPPSDGGECKDWTYDRMMRAVLSAPDIFHVAAGFKAPGWKISDGCYAVLKDAGWWCADHSENDERRPRGLQTHVLGDGDHWHGHLTNVCGNGIEETFDVLSERVREATEFQFVSQAVKPW